MSEVQDQVKKIVVDHLGIDESKIILESIETTLEQQCAADVNEDGTVDVLDIVVIIGYILGN